MGVGPVPIKKHTELTDKEVAGVMDHADGSVPDAKLSGVLELARIPDTSPLRNYGYGGILWDAFFESLDGFETDGTGTAVLSAQRMRIASAAVIGSYHVLYKSPSGTLASPTWAKKRRIKTRFLFSHITDIEAWILSGSGGDWGATDRHIGFKHVNGTLYGTVADGTTENTLNCGAVFAGISMLLELVFTPGSECRFYVDGVDKGALTTNLPSGTTEAKYIFWVEVKTSVAGFRSMDVAEWRFLQEP